MSTGTDIQKRSYLRRLPDEFYRGSAYVHWSMAIRDRRTGWLDKAMHFRFRDIQAHALHRYELACMTYCLMPDHIHLFWIGLGPASDQRKAARFFRDHFGDALRSRGVEFQKQPYDHVLREKDRAQDAVVRLAFYITENPVRAHLVENAEAWMFSGSHAIGYPDLDWRMERFPERFWKIYKLEAQKRM